MKAIHWRLMLKYNEVIAESSTSCYDVNIFMYKKFAYTIKISMPGHGYWT